MIGIVLMFVVQRMISKRLTPEKKEAFEVIISSSDDDDIKIIVDFDEKIGASNTLLDRQQLVPWRRRVLEKPYSRPASLVISRLLDDAQSTDAEAFQCGSLPGHSACDGQSAFTEYPIITTPEPDQIIILPKTYSQECENDKDTQSIISGHLDLTGNRESLILTHRDASGSINSDSGRSTASEETVSLQSGRSRASSANSTDTGFDTEIENDASSEDGTRYESQDTIYKPSCSLYSEKGSDSIDDIFSKLMEKALEIETVYHNTKCSSVDNPSISQVENPCTWEHVLGGTRETVL